MVLDLRSIRSIGGRVSTDFNNRYDFGTKGILHITLLQFSQVLPESSSFLNAYSVSESNLILRKVLTI
jgi:hypothetical protein